jgi:hypothetical protein
MASAGVWPIRAADVPAMPERACLRDLVWISVMRNAGMWRECRLRLAAQLEGIRRSRIAPPLVVRLLSVLHLQMR